MHTPQKTDTSNVTIRVDADSMLLCDGEHIEHPFKAGVLTKIQLPSGQHLLEFLSAEYPDVKIEKEVDFPEAGKSYLVIIKGLKDLVDAAGRVAAEKAAKRKAEAEAKRKGEEEARRKAEEEARRKTKEEAEAQKKAEIKSIVDLADDYYFGRNGKSKDYEEAVAHYRKAAAAGHAYAQYSLGCCYEKGEGVEKSAQEAVKWYRASADQGYASSQCRLGCCYEKGIGVEKSAQDAEKWYRKAADQGHAKAKGFLANLKDEAEAKRKAEEEAALKARIKSIVDLADDYYFGRNGKSKDYEEAVAHYRKAAAAGHAYAQYSLGCCYEKGEGVEKSAQEAVKWYRASADQGYASSQCRLGCCYEKGIGVEKSAQDAEKWYRKAADQGHAKAKGFLANLKDEAEAKRKAEEEAALKARIKSIVDLADDYYYGRNGKSKDYVEAAAHYRKAADAGHAYAQYSIGWCYEKGQGVEKSVPKAGEWYRKAVEQGNANAKERMETLKKLGDDYYYGRNDKSKNYEKAAECFRIAADMGDAYSQYSIGWCYEKGQGVKESVPDAVKWYRMAKDNGEKNAKERLENAKQLGLDYYFARNGKTEDFKKAVVHLRLAAENGDAHSQYALGWCYEKGQGISRSVSEAKSWYRKAAAQGHKHAKECLERLGN